MRRTNGDKKYVRAKAYSSTTFCPFEFARARFNYRATAYMVERGFYQFLNWFDERAWYPLGRIVGGTVYPGLMITSGGIHWLLHTLNIPVHIRDICVFLAPIFRYANSFLIFSLRNENRFDPQ